MNLTIEGDLAKQLTTLLKKDTSLARALAQQWVAKVEPNALYAYLLDQDTATDLLVQQLQKAPEKTLEDLHRLEDGKATKPIKKAVKRKPKAAPRKTKTAPQKRGPGRPKKTPSLPKKRGPSRPKKAKAKPAAKRIRLSAEQVQQAKDKVTGYLGKHGWSAPKVLIEVAGLTTKGTYRRIINELKEAGKIVSQGEKSKTVYGLKAKGRGRKKGRSKK